MKKIKIVPPEVIIKHGDATFKINDIVEVTYMTPNYPDYPTRKARTIGRIKGIHIRDLETAMLIIDTSKEYKQSEDTLLITSILSIEEIPYGNLYKKEIGVN